MEQQQNLYNRKRLVALGILVLLLIIVALLIWWWLRPKQQTSQPGSQIPESSRVVLPAQKQEVQQVPKPSEPPAPGETEVLNLARNFSERYGSWSTDSKFQNLVELFPSVTARLKREFQKTIDTATEQQEFKGIKTNVLQMSITKLTSTAAEVTVMTQRIETKADLTTSVGYETLFLTMIKQGMYWYVDTATWK